MEKPFVIRYKDGEERFNVKDIESKGYKVKFRDFAENTTSLSKPGGKLPINTHYDKLEAVTVEIASIPDINEPSGEVITIYRGSWGQEELHKGDTIVIPPGFDHEAENVSDKPVILLITNFIVEG